MVWKRMRKGLFLLVVVAALCAALVWYAKPTGTLNLEAAPISLTDKLLGMLQKKALDVVLTEHDLNQLVKRHFTEEPTLKSGHEVKGARLMQNGEDITVYLQLEKGALAFEIAVDMRMEWQSPNLLLHYTGGHVKQLPVPLHWWKRKPVVVPLAEDLPPFVSFRDVTFGPEGMTISLKLG